MKYKDFRKFCLKNNLLQKNRKDFERAQCLTFFLIEIFLSVAHSLMGTIWQHRFQKIAIPKHHDIPKHNEVRNVHDNVAIYYIYKLR